MPFHPQVFAHRGASAVAPESTRAAIREAVRAGASMVELDVQMTRDGRLVIFHDDRLERTTNGTGRLTATRYAALARLDAGTWFHARFSRERILLVSQALRLVPRRMQINLELKQTPHGATLARRLVRVVRRARVHQRLLVSSFDPTLLQALRPSRLSRALICRSNPDRSLQHAIRLRCQAWHPRHTLVTPRRIGRAHAAGLRVHAWTVDEVPRARRLAAWGVDGIFTNHPRRLIKCLACCRTDRTTAKSARHFSTSRLPSGKVPGTFCRVNATSRQRAWHFLPDHPADRRGGQVVG